MDIFLILSFFYDFSLSIVHSTLVIKWQFSFQPWSKPTSNGGQEINLGLIVPHSIFKQKLYKKAVSQGLAQIQKSKRRKLTKFHKTFNFGHSQVHLNMMNVVPSPTGEFARTSTLLDQNNWISDASNLISDN